MKILPQMAQDTGFIENVVKEAKYGIAGIGIGTILMKQGLIHWNVLSH
jgi:hypothetical protein